MNAFSIKKRLFLIILFFVCFPILILGWIWYETSTNTIENEAIQSNKKLIQQTNEYLDLYITNLENSTFPFVSNPQIQHFINSERLTRYRYFSLSETIENELFSQMIFGRTDIVGISLVGKNNMQINDYSSVKGLLNMEEIRQRNEQLLESTKQLDNFNIIGLQKIGSMPVLTVTRKIHSNTSYLYEGLLVIDINLKQISNISENLAIGDSDIWIVDYTGQIIYHSNSELLGTRLPKSVIETYTPKKSEVFITKMNKEKTIVIYEHSHVTDWILIAELPHQQIIGNLIKVRSMTIAIGIIIIIGALSVVGGFSLSITRSLHFLQLLMKRLENGDLNVKRSSIQERHDEIGRVFKSFYKMADELKRLYEEVHLSKLKEKEMEIKQKESTLQAMQSQINPHFLYNTLEIINSHAIIENNMSISKMTTSLAHMFRYNIGNAKQIVTLREEVSHIQSYLEIQCARYRHLHVDINMDEELLDSILTIRLTLQPLIENAFLHGYQNHKLKPTYIGIFGEKKESCYLLQIVDKGYGMDPLVKENYNLAFSNQDRHHTIEKEKKFNSIGLWNVHERIFLAFGHPYGLHIKTSELQSGTVFEVILPFNKGENECIV